MKMKKDIVLEEQADKLAKLTFLLARACEEKEQYFIKLYDLTNAEFRCMRFLHDKNFLSVKDLARQMKLTPGRISHILSSLEEKNYVNREIDKSDRRNIKVKLTRNAKPFISEVIHKHVELHEKVLQQMPEDSREYILEAMEQLYDSLTGWSKMENISH